MNLGGLRLASRQLKVEAMFLAVLLLANLGRAASSDASFLAGSQQYRAGDYPAAAQAFLESALRRPASGTFQNLGNAEWEQGRAGQAILAWEQALSLNPFNQAVRMNLRYARRSAQLEAPELAWYEVASAWLPVNWWGWIATGSFWLAVGMVTLPGMLRRRKAAWHQAIGALGLMIFLLSVPALAGVHTRSRMGHVLQKDTPLRLTPTADAQFISRLAAGEPARWERSRGSYILIRTSRGRGWVEQRELGLIWPGVL
jgi:hypothetical protein